MNRSPLFPAHQSLNAQFDVSGDWMLPSRYGEDIATEITALVESAALLDLAEVQTVTLAGPDARRFCNGIARRARRQDNLGRQLDRPRGVRWNTYRLERQP